MTNPEEITSIISDTCSEGKRRRYAPRLKTLTDVRRFLAKIIDRVHQGKISQEMGKTLGYLLNILINCIRTKDIEDLNKRLDAWEATHNVKS